MAKDTEKLIRQLSLIAYLMAERRPVTASEIRRDVEGYSDMTEDAFARRFYADRAELESLGIRLSVDKPADGFSEQENYSLAREAFHLPPIGFTDNERAALQTALHLLDGEFAYAEPLRLALQQITWGRPSPLDSPAQRTVGLGISASAGGADLSQRLAKIDTAIYRRKRVEFEYFTMQTGETAVRQVDPYHLFFEGGQFYLVGYSHEREQIRVFRLSRIRGKVSYATKAEHDFQRPTDFNPREYAARITWQLGEPVGEAEIWVSDRIAWFVERHFGRYGTFSDSDDGGRLFSTWYSLPRLVVSWVLGFGEHMRVLGPGDLVSEIQDRVDRVVELHRGEPHVAPVSSTAEPVVMPQRASEAERSEDRETSVRPERFARLVTLASVLIAAGRAGETLSVADVCEQLQLSEQELRDDVSLLNVVNFGGGAYVLYAEVSDDGVIEVDPEPYSDTFDRPARLLPIEAKALVAAIDLIGTHLPEGSLDTARDKIVSALGHDPVEEGLQIVSAQGDDPELASVIAGAVADSRLLKLEYYNPHDDVFTERVVEPYGLINSRDGWYVASYDPAKEDTRHFRLDRVKSAEVLSESFEARPDLDPIADIEGWPTTGVVAGSRVAQVWISPGQARWAREERTVLAELEDGSVIVAWTFKGTAFLAKDVLKEAGDAVVLDPPDAREAVLSAAEALMARS